MEEASGQPHIWLGGSFPADRNGSCRSAPLARHPQQRPINLAQDLEPVLLQAETS